MSPKSEQGFPNVENRFQMFSRKINRFAGIVTNNQENQKFCL